MGGWPEALGIQPELLREFLSRTQTGKYDGNILVWFEPGEPDDLPGKIQNTNRLAHIQDKNLAAVPHGGCLQYQLDGLRDSHKVARDRKSTRLNSSHVAISYAVF